MNVNIDPIRLTEKQFAGLEMWGGVDYWHQAKEVRNDLRSRIESQDHEDRRFAMQYAQRANTIDALYNMLKEHPERLPADYRGSGARFSKLMRQNADPLPIPDIDMFIQDQSIVQKYYDATPMKSILDSIPGVVVDTPLTRWDVRYFIQDPDKNWPVFTRKFDDPPQVSSGIEWAQASGIGWMIGYSMGWQNQREFAGSSYDPLRYFRMLAMDRMAVMEDEFLLLGTAGQHKSTLPDTYLGLFNYTGTDTEALGAGGDNDLTAAGDIEASIQKMLTDIKDIYEPGTNIIVSTSNVYEEMFEHRTTYPESGFDAHKVWQKFFQTGHVSAWYIDDRLYANTLDATHGQMMLLRIGPETVQIQQIYNLQDMAFNSKAPGDINRMMFKGSALYYKKVGAQTHNSADLVVSQAGYSNMRFYGASPVMSTSNSGIAPLRPTF